MNTDLEHFAIAMKTVLASEKPPLLILTMMMDRLHSIRPPIPFDLEPLMFDGKDVIYSTSQLKKREELHHGYDDVRQWHDMHNRLMTMLRESRGR